TLVGIWPAGLANTPPPDPFHERIRTYVTKALREAKVHTSWINPDQEYENAVLRFVDRLLDRDASAPFLADLQQFVDRIAPHGWLNGLSQTVLRCMAPGVPDTYQGTEAWDFSMVDPDNRRPVDYAARQALLKTLTERAARGSVGLARELAADMSAPGAKLFVTARALAVRRDLGDLFA